MIINLISLSFNNWLPCDSTQNVRIQTTKICCQQRRLKQTINDYGGDYQCDLKYKFLKIKN